MNKTPKWAFYTLFIAGIYNLLWGAWVILFPSLSFTLLGATPPQPIEIWQCVGMIVGVYGIGYIIAATDPNRHWPIILVGFLGKILGPIGFIQALATNIFPLSFGINIIFNDIIWWVPFFIILKQAFEHHQSDENIRDIQTSYFIEKKSKILIVAIRHLGCCFAKENLSHLDKHYNEIINKGIKVKVLHMGQNQELSEQIKKYSNLKNVELLSDPHREIYKKIGLAKGNLKAVLSFKIILKGAKSILRGNSVGPLRGDGFQLGGAALYINQDMVSLYKSEDASDLIPFETFLEK